MPQLNMEDKGKIIGMHLSGMTNYLIARELRISQPTVALWIKRYNEDANCSRMPGSGRKRKTSPQYDRAACRMVLTDRFTTAADILKALPAEDVSKHTIYRRIREGTDFNNYWAAKKPFISERNRLRRVEWCQLMLPVTIDEWMYILWSDESPFVLRYNHKKKVWRRYNERYSPQCTVGTVKHDQKIMVWGCFTGHGVGRLYLVEGIMEQNQYIRILEQEMLPSAQNLFGDRYWAFQQDNDPKHTARRVQEFIRQRGINLLPYWPSQSPDLNPIENLWSILDNNLKDRRPQSKAELFQVLQDGWNALDIGLLRRLVESMPRRIQAVIDANGYMTKY
jgi:transposase